MAASDTRSHMMVAEAAAEILSQKLDMLLYHPVPVDCFCVRKLSNDAKQKLATIQKFFSTRDRPTESKEWLERFLQAMHDAEDLIDKFHLREARGRHEALYVAARPLAALISKCMLWRDLSNLVSTMQELCEHQYLKEAKGDGEKDASVPWQGQKLARLTSFWDRQALTEFVCHKAKKKEIMKWVEDGAWSRSEAKLSTVDGISIWGEQGVGKSFLARSIYRQAMYLGFESSAWVHVSSCLDSREVLLDILMQVGKLVRDAKDMDLEDVLDMLLGELNKKKSFLIVLDDVHLFDQQLSQSLAVIAWFSRQGRIIITTRDKRIATSMPFQEKELGQLDDPESQDMLASKLHRAPEPQSLKTDKEILETCRGLPLCISLLGGLLSHAKDRERAALVEKCPNLTLLDIQQLSYDRLPVHLKPCFLYMALFPVASPIPTRRLVRLWLAEGFLDSHCYDREKKRTRQPEDVGETFILELADRNVIDVVRWRADGSPKACQMLTSLYDMIRTVVRSTGYLHIHAPSKSKGTGDDRVPTGQQQQLPAQPRESKVRWLAEHTNIVRDSRSGSNLDLNLSHVRSFLSFYPRRGMLTKDINIVLRNMTSKSNYSLLKVLDLEGVYKPALQGVLHKLVLLRYLGLRSTVLDSIPSAVADLQYLETLDIKHTHITSLPSSIWKSRKLRHLHLNWFYIDLRDILKACSNNAMALTELQTLSGLVIGEVKEDWIKDHTHSLATLTKLKLFLQQSESHPSGAAWKTVANWISSRLTNLQSLTLGSIQGAKHEKEEAKHEKEEAKHEKGKAKHEKEDAKLPPSAIGPLPKLSLAEGHHNLVELYLMGQLTEPNWTQLLPGSLRVLTLSGSMVETDMMAQLGDLLKNLRTLRLLANSFLGTHMRFAKDGFPSLMILKIWKLPHLEEVTIEQEALHHLKELEFRHLDAMKDVIGIKECKELESIYALVKRGAQDFVGRLEKGKADTTVLYKIESTDDDFSDEDHEATSP